ncbi:hypothetical protein H257_06508 [Aphanomyces astaci]|uniref:Uncharacterized protein n=1 Tax=Aphanomyces astaci TaxID=112090 RepID=W4GLA8_APHAT|nr:hypothetical protein H257_06508 [Aphanomyces astaci]ETV80126.1 hypothetical protein H257_06508 [Aphanomyces astaci]|eukprot:XP_009830050.1 hypothetical protein H257_06508 [Aphanomyces astaci]
MTKGKDRDMTVIARRREQSRASIRRWRANEQVNRRLLETTVHHWDPKLLLQTILDTLRQQVNDLEAELKGKLSVVGTGVHAMISASVEGHDYRLDQRLAKKRFFIAQNMQLQEALKMHMDNLNHVASLMSRVDPLNTQATLYDDSFLLYITQQTQVKLRAMDLRRHFSGAEHNINGISCVAVSRGAYQDRSMFLPLANRVADHKVVPTLNVAMTVIETTSWTLSNPNHLERRYLVVHRELSMSNEYTVTVTALSENLVPAPHAFCFEATNITPWAYTRQLVGTCV